MKTTRTIYLFLGLVTVLFLVFASVVTAYAASKNYNGVTTVVYNNTIVDGGGSGWSPGHQDYTTNPGRVMDQFGKNVWTTYNSCNLNLVPQSWLSYQVQNNPWMMQYNVSSIWDSMARSKIDCAIGQVQRGHNYMQHYWQDAPYSGSGGTLDTSKILTNP